MTRRLNMDWAKAGPIAAHALEQWPALRDQLARQATDGQHWTLRAWVGEDDCITIAVAIDSRTVAALWHGPRDLVERGPVH